jgi:hypothetical protein
LLGDWAGIPLGCEIIFLIPVVSHSLNHRLMAGNPAGFLGMMGRMGEMEGSEKSAKEKTL